MEIEFLILAALVLFSSFFIVNEADALIAAYSLEDLAETAEFVVIGKVIEVSPLVPGYLLVFSDGYDRFQFDVTLSVENDLDEKYDQDTIKFRIHDSREEFGMGIEDEQNFEVGERILVFIGEKEPDSVMGDAYLVHGVTQGKYLLRNGIAFGTHFPEGIEENELILKIKNIRHSEPIPEPKQDTSVPKKCGPGTAYHDGICVVNEAENSVKSESNRWGGPALNHDVNSPLKQLKSGIKFHNIDCKDGLELVYKKADDTSACVTLETKIELVIRGWGEDDRLLLGCTPSRYDVCYPSDPQEYRKALYDYYFDDTDLPSSGSFDFPSLHTINACSENAICFGQFENGTKIRVSCDYPIHGCGVLSFDDYKTDDKSVEWKKYITVSASRIDESPLPDMLKIQPVGELSENKILPQLISGADGCKDETEMCALPRGVTLERLTPLGIRVVDHDDYTISLDEEKANNLFSQIEWTIEEDGIYSVLESQQKYYFVVLSTFDDVRTPDVKMRLIDTFHDPINMKRGEILNYTIQLETWATYGPPARIDLRAVQDAKDSGIKVWIEPDVLEIPERSNATATLFIQSSDDAKDGIYDIRVIGRANERLADLYCRNTICPTVNIGESDWSIRTFGSSSGMGIGGGKPPDNTRVEIELNKSELFEGDNLEIKTFVINNGTEPIVLENPRVLVKVIKADSTGYYDHFYGIDAENVLDKPLVLEPKSKTLLVRPFYWDQMILQDDEEHRIDPSQRKITMYFAGGPYSWNTDVWFDIK